MFTLKKNQKVAPTDVVEEIYHKANDEIITQ
jgi:hypothetical protein